MKNKFAGGWKAEKIKKLERCGFCGMFFRGIQYIPDEELYKIDKEVLDKTPLGYCPNANEESELL